MPLNVRELGKSFFFSAPRWFHKLPSCVRFNHGWPRSTEKLLPSSHPFSVSMYGCDSFIFQCLCYFFRNVFAVGIGFFTGLV